jgi:hypothetical protein
VKQQEGFATNKLSKMGVALRKETSDSSSKETGNTKLSSL